MRFWSVKIEIPFCTKAIFISFIVDNVIEAERAAAHK